ncbi:Signal transduction histidine kinase, homodimeric domain [Pseudocohnilembus persalinus]|uniref:histidine kinase n=1 Tax=Pseudocohnilembus persalinus TaxID=266149 RepID=A0A0V0QYI8_PSEPJ|nr:Signal transduction histidine kinase, homodimeric domain [Pseudocohnilembus persalinus]|eukprot:KRX07233.1 Signal transduction histidine kinase, homodimeric domain [Pseudocohnilembus persalinus]
MPMLIIPLKNMQYDLEDKETVRLKNKQFQLFLENYDDAIFDYKLYRHVSELEQDNSSLSLHLKQNNKNNNYNTNYQQSKQHNNGIKNSYNNNLQQYSTNNQIKSGFSNQNTFQKQNSSKTQLQNNNNGQQNMPSSHKINMNNINVCSMPKIINCQESSQNLITKQQDQALENFPRTETLNLNQIQQTNQNSYNQNSISNSNNINSKEEDSKVKTIRQYLKIKFEQYQNINTQEQKEEFRIQDTFFIRVAKKKDENTQNNISIGQIQKQNVLKSNRKPSFNQQQQQQDNCIEENNYYLLDIQNCLWNDQSLHVVLTLNDITEQMNYHNNKIQEEIQTNMFKDQILATVSHDFRTPLNAIQNHIQLSQQEIFSYQQNLKKERKKIKQQQQQLSQQLQIDNYNNNNSSTMIQSQNQSRSSKIIHSKRFFDHQKIQQFNEIAYQNCEMLQLLVQDILDYSQNKYSKIKLNPEKFPFQELIQEIRYLVEIPIKDKGLKFRLRIDDYTTYTNEKDVNVEIQQDKLRLKQIIMNLITNAIKFTEQGSISLRIKFFTRDQVELLKVCVIDTGIGIDKQKQERIFDRFQSFQEKQVNTKSKMNGIGLGLSISEDLVELIGPFRKIHLESTEGKGSIFQFIVYRNLSKGLIHNKPFGEERAMYENSDLQKSLKLNIQLPKENLAEEQEEDQQCAQQQQIHLSTFNNYNSNKSANNLDLSNNKIQSNKIDQQQKSEPQNAQKYLSSDTGIKENNINSNFFIFNTNQINVNSQNSSSKIQKNITQNSKNSININQDMTQKESQNKYNSFQSENLPENIIQEDLLESKSRNYQDFKQIYSFNTCSKINFKNQTNYQKQGEQQENENQNKQFKLSKNLQKKQMISSYHSDKTIKFQKQRTKRYKNPDKYEKQIEQNRKQSNLSYKNSKSRIRIKSTNFPKVKQKIQNKQTQNLTLSNLKQLMNAKNEDEQKYDMKQKNQNNLNFQIKVQNFNGQKNGQAQKNKQIPEVLMEHQQMQNQNLQQNEKISKQEYVPSEKNIKINQQLDQELSVDQIFDQSQEIKLEYKPDNQIFLQLSQQKKESNSKSWKKQNNDTKNKKNDFQNLNSKTSNLKTQNHFNNNKQNNKITINQTNLDLPKPNSNRLESSYPLPFQYNSDDFNTNSNNSFTSSSPSSSVHSQNSRNSSYISSFSQSSSSSSSFPKFQDESTPQSKITAGTFSLQTKKLRKKQSLQINCSQVRKSNGNIYVQKYKKNQKNSPNSKIQEEEIEENSEEKSQKKNQKKKIKSSQKKISLKILVVDDNAFNIRTAQNLLEHNLQNVFDFEFKTAFNGEEAVKIVSQCENNNQLSNQLTQPTLNKLML